MTHGKLLLINVDMVSPNIICEHHGVDWPAADIWNYEKFKQNEINESLVRDGEDYDHMGGKGFHR